MSSATGNLRLLLTADVVGGVWQYATDLARALAPLGVETILAVLGPAPDAGQRAAARAIAGVTLIETELPLDWLATDAGEVRIAGARIAELARHMSVDLVQLNQPALAGDIGFPVPVIAVAHSCLATWWDAVEGGTPPADFTWRSMLHEQGLRAAARIVTPSVAFAEATRRAYGLAAAPVAVHNGRRPFALPSATMGEFAFTAGRLWDQGKNFATLDRAAARLSVPVKAAGSLRGPNGEQAIPGHVDALGHIGEDAIAACLAARPVFVSAARYEPFGLAVLEAAQAGCALVLSDIPTFRELWSDAATFVAPDDDAGFAAAITDLIGDPVRRAATGERARAAAACFTPEHMAAGMLDIYRALAPRDARAAA